MLNFLNIFRKKIDTKNIKNFHDVVKVTNFYISEKKWDQAHKILNDTKKNENDNTKNFINSLNQNDIEYESKKTSALKKLNKNLDKIKKLELKLSENESKYKFVPESIKRYDDAVKSIKTLILLKDWKKAKEVIKEIKKIEKKGLDNLLNTLEKQNNVLETDGEKKKQVQIFNKKEEQLEKLLNNILDKEQKYIEKINKDKFNIRFNKIKGEIKLLSKTGKNNQALNLLKSFLEKNKEHTLVIEFYNKEKVRILKNIEKQKEREKEKIKKNIKYEAQKLAGLNIKIDDKKVNKKKDNIFQILNKKLNLYNSLKEKIRNKKLIDEVSLLIEENENMNREIAAKKLENLHKGLNKELHTGTMNGYDLFGKILGANKISGDTFGLVDNKNKYNFYIGDATGHGIKAGLIVTLLTRLFNKFVKKKNLRELVYEINNGLKQDLQSKNFITSILFEIKKEEINKVNYAGMGHEPILVYRKKTNEVEKIIAGGLAAGIRMITDITQIKEKQLRLENGDILLVFSDGVTESKGINNEFYGLERLKNSFKKAAKIEKKSQKIYSQIIDDLILFRGGTAFNDDNTILILKRDEDSDIQKKDSKYLKTISEKEKIDKKNKKRLIGKNKFQIQNEVKKIKKEKELQLILVNLKKLFEIGEFLKLKQEAIRYIKDGWVHKDINLYLKKAIENETEYKISLKNKKIENRYNVIKQLYKKGDYNTVIQELEDIISKDGEI